MPDPDSRLLDLTFERGVSEAVEASMIPPGAAARLRNWQPDPTGGLRTRVGWLRGSTTGAPATRRGRGIGHLARPHRPYRVQKDTGSITDNLSALTIADLAWPVATTAGNLLVLKLSGQSSTSTITSFAVPGGWVLAADSTDQAPVRTAIYYKENSGSESGSVSVTMNQTSVVTATFEAEISEVANVATSGSLHRTGPNASAVDAADTATLKASIASESVITSVDTALDEITTVAVHGFTVGDKVQVWVPASTGVLPAPLSENTTYYVTSTSTTSKCTLSTTLGGPNVDLTAAQTNPAYIGRETTVPVTFATSVLGWGDVAAVGTTISATLSGETDGWTEVSDINIKRTGSTEFGGMGTYEKIYEVPGIVKHQATLSVATVRSRSCVAVFVAASSSTTDGFYLATNDDNIDSLDVYYIDRTNLAAGTFTLLEAVTATDRILPVAYASGLGAVAYTHPSFANVRYWQGLGTTPGYLSTSPSGARCIAFHKDRLFVGGPAGEPWALYYTDVGSLTSWPATNLIDVGKNDGEFIEDITPFQNFLVVAKQTSLYILSGSGADSWNLVRLPLGGSAPGRTLMPTPIGCMVAGIKNVWLISGDSVERISRPIESSYGMTGNYMSSAYVKDVYYVCDVGSGVVWALNTSTGTWHEERVDTAVEAPASLYNQDEKLLYAPSAGTVGSLLNYRLMPGSARAKDYDTLAETFEAWTQEIWTPEGPLGMHTPRHLYLQVRQRGGTTGQTGLTVTPYYNGTAGTAKTFGPETAAGVYRYRFDLGEKHGIRVTQFRLTQTVTNGQASVVDPEKAVFEYNVEKIR